MPKINQLKPATSLANTDIMIADTSTGSDTRKIAYSDLRTQVQNESKSVFALKGEIASDDQVADAVGDWLDAHVTPTGSAVAIDDTLKIQGAAADAKAAGEIIVVNGTSGNGTRVNITTTDTDIELAEMSDVTELKSALKESIGNPQTETLATTNGYLIDTSVSIGSTVDLTPTQNSGFCYLVYPCTQGQKFIITGKGGSTGRLWAFLDSSDKLVSHADASITGSDLVVTADTTGSFVFNAQTNQTRSVKVVKSISESITTLDVDSHHRNIEEMIIEQGGVRSDGVLTATTTRVRNAVPVTANGQILQTLSGYVVYAIAYYTKASHALSSFEVVNTNKAVLKNDRSLETVIAFAKADTTQNIVPDDIKDNLTLEYLYGEIDASKETYLESLLLEQGGFNSAGVLQDNDKRVRTAFAIPVAGQVIKAPTGINVFALAYFNKSDGTFSSFSSVQQNKITLAENSTLTVLISFAKTTSTDTLTVDEVKGNKSLEIIEKGLPVNPSISMDKIMEFDDSAYDDVDDINYTEDSTTHKYTIMEQLYSKFDALVTDYPSYVTKVNVATEYEITKPSYASSYDTYMYIISIPSIAAKKKLLLYGGEHGDEYVGQIDTYLFAKRLCAGFDNPDYFRFANLFDVYIIPTLNGYGAINRQRTNGNGVDINRNYPTRFWADSTAETKGPSAGSEYETQIIVHALEAIKPDIILDHHNFSYNLAEQFFGLAAIKSIVPIVFQTLCDASYMCKKEWPTAFGTSHEMLVALSGEGTYVQQAGTAEQYFAETGNTGYIIETSDCVNYTGGIHNNTPTEKYGAKVYTIGEYIIRNAVFRLAQAVIDNTMNNH